MPTISGYDWTTIAASRVDADSPVDETLMGDLVDNDNFLMSWLGGTYLANATLDHNHDGSNSAKIAGASGGSKMAVLSYECPNQTCWVRRMNFLPEWVFIASMNESASNGVHVKTTNMAATADMRLVGSSSTVAIGRGLDQLFYGGVGLTDFGTPDTLNVGGDYYTGLFLSSSSGLIASGSYTGTGTTKIVSTGFQPKLVMIVATATGSATDLQIKTLNMASTTSKAADNSGTNSTDAITAFSATSFTVSTHVNVNQSSVAYDWIALTTGTVDGEKIGTLTWTGNASAARAITGLGFAPQAVIVIREDATSTQMWFATCDMQGNNKAWNWCTGVIGGANTDLLWGSDGITVDTDMNTSGGTYIAYCFSGGTRHAP